MIIALTKSKLFTEEPDIRFCKEYGLPRGTWTELWRRHALLSYTPKELCEYYEIKTKRKTSNQSMQRWIWRTEVYCKANHIMKMGVETVNSDFFGDFEMEVVKELLKNVRSVKNAGRALV